MRHPLFPKHKLYKEAFSGSQLWLLCLWISWRLTEREAHISGKIEIFFSVFLHRLCVFMSCVFQKCKLIDQISTLECLCGVRLLWLLWKHKGPSVCFLFWLICRLHTQVWFLKGQEVNHSQTGGICACTSSKHSLVKGAFCKILPEFKGSSKNIGGSITPE